MESSKGFPPIVGSDARVLILGSLPGQRSLLAQRYYAHPRNAFWPIMAALYGISGSYDERCRGIVKNALALWDVLDESQRPGSLDADIRVASAKPNDFSEFLHSQQSLQMIVFNGKKAEQLFRRLVKLPSVRPINFLGLPSTSPAFARLSITDKTEAWREGLIYGR
jgi:hypoxanthine-DNA glycosylase